MVSQSDPVRKRRRRREPGDRLCPHCGRSFKRTEHLERHRITLHEDVPQESPEGADGTPNTPAGQRLNGPVWLQGSNVGNLAAHLEPGAEAGLGSAPEQRNIGHGNGPAPDPAQPLLFPHLYSHEGIELDAQFHDFTSFLDGVGLPTEWSPYFPRHEVYEPVDPALGGNGSSRPGTATPRSRPETPLNSWLPSAPGQPNHLHIVEYRASGASRADPQPYRVSDLVHAHLQECCESFREVLDQDFVFPSRHALTRYISSFFDGFHPHMPFIHCPTWRMSDHSMELILGLAAIGAQYCFEHRNAEKLFYAGKAILMVRLVHNLNKFGPNTRPFLNLQGVSSGERTAQARGSDWDAWEPMETVRALIALMAYSTWEMKVSLLHEAFALQGLLVEILRYIGLGEDEGQADNGAPTDDEEGLKAAWHAWIRQEVTRRSKLVAFSFLHTHSIAYNVYPVLRTNEINLRLPCSTREWKATTALQWQLARHETPKQQQFFQDALSHLLRNRDGAAPLDPIPTPLGNYVLLHGLLQRIHIVRDLSLPVMDRLASLPAEEVEKLERGLRSWTSGWQQAPESSLDPNNESGPIPFTSSSLLGLAYARIYLHLGPHRQLDTRDPVRVAHAISRAPAVERSTGVISALLYSAHMLSIPVRLGVYRAARSQAFFWSVRHSLAVLECAILLSKWLSSVAASTPTTPLSDGEDKILHWVRCIVDEAYTAIEFDNDDADPQTLNRNPATLSLAVLRIWAHFFESNTQWPFINMIGTSMKKYRELLIRSRRAT
ncbi:hypothetical protein J3459_008305 [Metarhizium acridum]|nr:hypothetical protein J3459_008305 [Metarhizium acridum]